MFIKLKIASLFNRDSNNNIIDPSLIAPLAYGITGGYWGFCMSMVVVRTGHRPKVIWRGRATRYAIQDIRNIANKPYNANLKYYDHFKQVLEPALP